MINITGDTADELAVLQTLLETGMINSNKDTMLDITYKLSSGNILLVDQYNHIIGEKGQDCRDCKEFEDCPCGKDGHENGTSQGYSIGECKDFTSYAAEIFENQDRNDILEKRFGIPMVKESEEKDDLQDL